MNPRWRAELDSLAFQPANHRGVCVMHRRAFRALLGHQADAQECLDYFSRNSIAFEAAARGKIDRRALAPDANFHLTSRDISRQ